MPAYLHRRVNRFAAGLLLAAGVTSAAPLHAQRVIREFDDGTVQEFYAEDGYSGPAEALPRRDRRRDREDGGYLEDDDDDDDDDDDNDDDNDDDRDERLERRGENAEDRAWDALPPLRDERGQAPVTQPPGDAASERRAAAPPQSPSGAEDRSAPPPPAPAPPGAGPPRNAPDTTGGWKPAI